MEKKEGIKKKGSGTETRERRARCEVEGRGARWVCRAVVELGGWRSTEEYRGREGERHRRQTDRQAEREAERGDWPDQSLGPRDRDASPTDVTGRPRQNQNHVSSAKTGKYTNTIPLADDRSLPFG